MNCNIAPIAKVRRWHDHVVCQQWHRFTADDHEVWDLLFERQERVVGPRLVAPFRRGLEVLHLSKPGIPELAELNLKLGDAAGWTCVAVPGIIPDADFFAMLEDRVFPVGNFIRRRDQLDYLSEPDCFHDLFGHVPLLADPGFAALMQHIGRIGVAACAAGEGEKVTRLYWHSIEFGLAFEDGERKILGAGLASSFGEAAIALDDPAITRPRFTLARASATDYRHDDLQPLYMVSDSLEQLGEWLADLDLARLRAMAI